LASADEALGWAAVTGDGLAGVETRWSVRRLFSTMTGTRSGCAYSSHLAHALPDQEDGQRFVSRRRSRGRFISAVPRNEVGVDTRISREGASFIRATIPATGYQKRWVRNQRLLASHICDWNPGYQLPGRDVLNPAPPRPSPVHGNGSHINAISASMRQNRHS